MRYGPLALAGALACYAIACPSEAASTSAVTDPITAPRSSLVDQVWCCSYRRRARHHHLRWYWLREPYTYDYYYGFQPRIERLLNGKGLALHSPAALFTRDLAMAPRGGESAMEEWSARS